jgi:hypothetical protein
MSKNKGGRPPGARNKNSWKVLNELKNHNFEIIPEIVEMFGHSKEIYMALFTKVHENLEAKRSPTHDFTEEEVDMMNNAAKSMGDILGKLLGYCYPKLKALEVGTSTGEQINFNINIPQIEQAQAPKQVVNKSIDLEEDEYQVH